MDIFALVVRYHLHQLVVLYVVITGLCMVSNVKMATQSH